MVNAEITKSELAILLSKLKLFKKPMIKLEQYPTDSEIAAEWLWNAYMLGDISNKTIVDLGCGTGILGISALLLGAKEVFFIDTDKDALSIAGSNIKGLEDNFQIRGRYHFIKKDIKHDDINIKSDTLIQNPPFGVKLRHADRLFLEKAVDISKVIYSMHKSESEDFINNFAKDRSFKITNRWKYDFPIKNTMKSHKSRIIRIKVKVYRLIRD